MNINKSRKFKAANVIQIALIDILRNKAKTLDIRFSKLDVTITKVEVTSDLKIAKCFFVPTYGLNKMPLEEILQTLHFNVKSIRLLLTKINSDLHSSPDTKSIAILLAIVVSMQTKLLF